MPETKRIIEIAYCGCGAPMWAALIEPEEIRMPLCLWVTPEGHKMAGCILCIRERFLAVEPSARLRAQDMAYELADLAHREKIPFLPGMRWRRDAEPEDPEEKRGPPDEKGTGIQALTPDGDYRPLSELLPELAAACRSDDDAHP